MRTLRLHFLHKKQTNDKLLLLTYPKHFIMNETPNYSNNESVENKSDSLKMDFLSSLTNPETSEKFIQVINNEIS